MQSSSTKSYLITVRNNDGSSGVTLMVSTDELGVDFDILADLVRQAFLTQITEPTGSFIDKSEVYSSAIYPT